MRGSGSNTSFIELVLSSMWDGEPIKRVRAGDGENIQRCPGSPRPKPQYTKQARKDRAQINDIGEAMVRAAWKGGAILRIVERAAGGHPEKNPFQAETSFQDILSTTIFISMNRRASTVCG